VPTTISASRQIEAGAADVYAFLAKLGNHWRLADGGMRLIEVAPGGGGGVIAMHGPLGLRRVARTELTVAVAPERLEGHAYVGDRTRAHVSWRIAGEESSDVELVAIVLSAGRLDRALLGFGGRGWLRRRFEAVLTRLEAELAPARA